MVTDRTTRIAGTSVAAALIVAGVCLRVSSDLDAVASLLVAGGVALNLGLLYSARRKINKHLDE
jgi:hypothetical protein